MELDYLYGVVWLQTAASAQCWILVWLLYICTILLICPACIRCWRIVLNSISHDDPRNTWIYSTLKIHRSAKPILTFASLLVQVFPEKNIGEKNEASWILGVWWSCFCLMLLHVSLLSCLPASLVYWLLGLLCASLFSLVPAMSWLLSFWKTQGEVKIIPEPSHDSCNYEWTTALPNTAASHIEIQHPTIAIVFPKHLRNWLDSIIIEWKLLQGLSLSAGLRSHCRVYRLQSIHTKQWISPRQGVQWSLTGPVCQKKPFLYASSIGYTLESMFYCLYNMKTCSVNS